MCLCSGGKEEKELIKRSKLPKLLEQIKSTFPDNTQAPVQMNFRNSMQAYQDALPMNQMPTQTFKPHKNINEN